MTNNIIKLYNFFNNNSDFTELKYYLFLNILPNINELDHLTNEQIKIIELYADIILSNKYDKNSILKHGCLPCKIYLYKLLILTFRKWNINEDKYSYYRSVGILELNKFKEIKNFKKHDKFNVDEYFKLIENENINKIILYLDKYYNGYLEMDKNNV